MKNYKEVTTQDEMEELLDSISGFHDSMTKEFYVVNRGYVTPDHGMMMSHQFDGRFLLQSEWEPYGIELLFEEITSLEASDPSDYWDASGEVILKTFLVKRKEIKMRFGSGLFVTAARLYYRERPDWLGKRAFLGNEVPSSDAVQARRIDDTWRQCCECGDAWEEDARLEFSYCTGCGSLTRLEPLESQ